MSANVAMRRGSAGSASSYHKRKQRTPPTPSFLAKQARRQAPGSSSSVSPLGFDTPGSRRPHGRVSLPHLHFSASSLASLADGRQRESRHSMPALMPANRKQLPPLSARSGSTASPVGMAGSGGGVSHQSSHGRVGRTPSPGMSPRVTLSFNTPSSPAGGAGASPGAGFHSGGSSRSTTPNMSGLSMRQPSLGAAGTSLSLGGDPPPGPGKSRPRPMQLSGHGMMAPTPKGPPRMGFFSDFPSPTADDAVQHITHGMRKLQSPRGPRGTPPIPPASVPRAGQQARRRRSSGTLRPLPFATPSGPAMRTVVTPDDAAAITGMSIRGHGSGGGSSAGAGAAAHTTSPALSLLGDASPAHTPDSSMSGLSGTTATPPLAAKPPATGSPSNSPRKRGRRRRPMGLKLKINASVDAVAPPEYDTPGTKLTQCSSTLAAVEDFLYVGGMDAAKDLTKLQAIGITHILNCVGATAPNCFPEHFTYCTLELSDRNSQDISCFAYPMIEFIERARADGGKVLVHCVKGISRSTSAVIVYLIWRNKWGFETAFRRVRQARREANPNAAFALQISDWERIRAAQHASNRPLCYRVGVHATTAGNIPLAVGPLSNLQLGMFLDADSSSTMFGAGAGAGFGAGAGAGAGSFEAERPTPTRPMRRVGARAASPASQAVSMAQAFLVVGNNVCYVWHDPGEPGAVVEAAKRLANVAMTLEGFEDADVTVVTAGEEPAPFWRALKEVHGSAVNLAPGLQAFCAEKSSLNRSNSIVMARSDGSDLQSKWGDSSFGSSSMFKSSSSANILQHLHASQHSHNNHSTSNMTSMSFVSAGSAPMEHDSEHDSEHDARSINSEDADAKAASDEEMGL